MGFDEINHILRNLTLQEAKPIIIYQCNISLLQA